MRKETKIIAGKNGNGFDTFKISIPKKILEEVGITKENPEIILEVEENKIIISKKN